MDKLSKSKVPALSRAIHILDFIAMNERCSASMISSALNLPKSSSYLLLDELKHLRLLAQTEDGYYRLGLKLMELGSQSIEQLDLRKIARQYLNYLTSTTGLVCHLGILDDDTPIYLLKTEPQSAIQVRSWEGKRVSLYSSALGKCLLAWSPSDKREKLIANLHIKIMTPYTLSTKQQLINELQLIRQRGWSFDNQEDLLNIQCIAAPIFDASHQITAAISAVGTTLQITEQNLQILTETVVHTATQISQELGYIKNKE